MTDTLGNDSGQSISVLSPEDNLEVVHAPRTTGPSRRHLMLAPLVVAGAVACTPAPKPKAATAPPAPAPAPPPPPPPQPVVPLTADHVANRLTFGPTPGLVAAISATGITAWIDRQLAPAGLPDAEGRLSGAAYQSLRNSNLANYAVRETSGGQDRIFNAMDHANLQRAIYSEQQLYELMCDFWGNYFNIWRRHTWMGFLRTRDYEDVVRANALGKFSTMLSASAHSPAMLDYLDNLSNDASRPGGVNQNYARELLELHSMGIINGEHVYTEADVQAVAQIISGFALESSNASPNRFNFKFLANQHSRTAVSCFGGAISFPARAVGQGYADGVALVDYLAHHPSTARYVCWKLCRRFVGDNPPMALVDSAAAVFTANDTAIAPTLRHILMSQEFASSVSGKVRRPLEHMVACLRALGATMSNDPEGTSADALRDALYGMGQPIFERVTPDGYPDFAAHWVSSDGLINRWETSGLIARNGLGSQSNTADRVRVDLNVLLPNPLPATVADLISWMAANLADFTMSSQDVTDLCTALTVTPTAVSTTLKNDTTKFPLAVGLILSHPTFQRR